MISGRAVRPLLRFSKPLLSFFILTIFLFASTADAEEDRLKIGFIGSFSGPGSAWGAACRNGFELGLEEISRPFTVIYEDDQLVLSKTVSAFNKLVERDGVNLIVVLSSGPSMAIAPLAEKRKVPLLAWASNEKVSLGRRYVLRTWPSAEREAAVMAAEAAQRGYDKLGFIISINDFTQAIARGFRSQYKLAPLLIDEEYPPETQDFRPFLLKASAKGVKQLGTCLSFGQSGMIAKQAKELSLNLELFGCESFEDSEEHRIAAGALNGAWYVSAQSNHSFAQKYQTRFGTSNLLTAAGSHYDLAHLLLRKNLTGKMSAEQIMQALLSPLKVSGALGEFQVVSVNGDNYIDFSMGVSIINKKDSD
ncbi:MAG: ABC transporter substrate-binding protein [Deltaproteobacteria bacterium]|nr:ABC transporter substrate-binding protein [Deltaproteobacteria bacterium]